MSFIPQELTSILSSQAPVEGSLESKIALVGEALGEKEDRERRPFVGVSGQKLERLMHSAGIMRSECYITNVIKERPPNNDIKHFIDLSKKVPIVTPRAKEYIQQLKEELEQCQAHVIVAIGGTALYALTGQTQILKWRGSILESSLLPGRKVVPTIHPRAVLPPTGVFIWEYWITSDLMRVKEESKYPEIRLPAMNLKTGCGFQETMDFLDQCRKQRVVDVDIEVLREEVSCIAFTFDGITAMSIPFVWEGGDFWTPDQEGEIWRKIASILEDPMIVKRGQNFLFDTSFLLRKHGIRTVSIIDTMIAQAVLYPDFPKGLDFITSTHTRIPYYKDEGKKWSRLTGNWTQHWEYNCKDVIATAQAYPSIISQLEQQNNTETYYRQVRLVEPLSFMSERGIRMDIANMQMANEAITGQISYLTEEFYKACGGEINPNSTKQLQDYFYGKLGIKPYKNRKTGADTLDGQALKRLSRRGYKEASILLELRKLGKLKGTYLDVRLDADHRLRCAFNPVGTETGRLSSGKTIFDTGTNL